MFGLKALGRKMDLVPPEPVELKVDPIVQVTAEYKALAAKLGVVVREDPHEKKKVFEAFLAENGIRVYPRAKVDRFLQIEADVWAEGTLGRGREGRVVWRPIRQSSYGNATYAHPIPYPVLLTIEKIQDKFSAAEFAVSDYEAPVPDPFLMVTYAGRSYVIEHWDEPGFLPFLNKEEKK